MSSQPLVLGLGAATWDRFQVVPEFPSGEGVTLASTSLEQGGGPVATALCVLSALGHRTALLDAQSDDATGQNILSELQEHGVDVSHLRVHPGATSAFAHILVRTGDGARHIIHTPATCPEFSPDDLPEEIIRGARLLHLNGRHESAARQAVKIAKKAGVIISFDGGAGRYRDSIRDLVLQSDVRILSKDFALRFAGTSSLEVAAQVLREDCPSLLVITDGAQGSWIWPQDEPAFHQEAIPVSHVIDTTGCGDVYHGAFLHGWLAQGPLRETAAFAARLAAKNAEGLGGRHALTALLPEGL